MHFGHKFWCSEIAIQKCVLTQSHFRCILDISFCAVKLQSKSDALPTKCVLTHSHFRGILELSFGSNMHFNALIQKTVGSRSGLACFGAFEWHALFCRADSLPYIYAP